jgi:hypothetical protein
LIRRAINKLLAKTGFVINKATIIQSNPNDIKRLQDLAQTSSEIKLHFGCGARILKGWVNIDLTYTHYGPYLQFYTDQHYPESIRGTRDDLFIIDILHEGLPLEDNSVDLIFHEDFFEHLNQKQQIIFLAETLRVMKPGAVHRINTPNLVASMRDNSDFIKGKKGVFIGEWDWWHHYNVITPAILEEMAKMVGYSEIKFNSKNHSAVAALLPSEYRPDHKDRPATDSNVFADLIK